jgi:hypothetical protein
MYIMSVKSRSRLAASLPNYTEKYSRAAPSNDQGGGNKKQGLAPVATNFYISGNGLAGWNQYTTRTYAPKKDFVFCINQLGGVGRSMSQFKVAGYTQKPDGVRKCTPYNNNSKNVQMKMST